MFTVLYCYFLHLHFVCCPVSSFITASAISNSAQLQLNVRCRFFCGNIELKIFFLTFWCLSQVESTVNVSSHRISQHAILDYECTFYSHWPLSCCCSCWIKRCMNHAQVACITVPANNLVNFSANFQPVIKHTVKFKKLRISIIPFFPCLFQRNPVKWYISLASWWFQRPDKPSKNVSIYSIS